MIFLAAKPQRSENRNVSKVRQFGVWISVAVLRFVACCCVGYYAGIQLARWRVRRIASNQRPEVARLNAKLDALSNIQLAKILKDASSECSDDPDGGLAMALRRMSRTEPDASIKHVVDYELGIALVNSADHAERSGNEGMAVERFREAQSIFAELGWKDTSENALGTLIERKDEVKPSPSPGACND
jgi:hypothetical protein